MQSKGIRANFKFWLETEDGYVFGEGPFELLNKIREMGTLSSAAEALGMSYRHAWGVIKDVEKKLGIQVLLTHKGGAKGGGGAELTEEGKSLASKYHQLKEAYSRASRLLSENRTDQAIGLDGYVEGTVTRIQDEEAAIVEIELDGGGKAKFLLNKSLAREKELVPGVKLLFELRDANLRVDRKHS